MNQSALAMKLSGQNPTGLFDLQIPQLTGEAPRLGFWICEPSRDRLWPTDSFWQITELLPSQIGARLSAFYGQLHPDDRTALSGMMERTSIYQTSLNVEVRLKGAGAEMRKLRLQAGALGTRRGVPQIVGTVCEASSSDQERELSELRGDVKSFLDHSPEIVVRLNPAGAVLIASSRFQSKLNTGSILNAPLLQHLREVGQSAISTRAPQQTEYCVEVIGRLQWLETCAIPEMGADGNIASVLTFTRDVTKRKLSEDLLESSKRSLLVAMESMELAHDAAGLGYWDRDMATNTMHWSDRVYTMFGRTPGSVTPSHEEWMRLVHPEDYEFCEAALKQAIGLAGKYRCQYRIILADGSIRWIEENGKLIRDFSGNPARMIGTIANITEQKEQEKALVHFEKLSSAMRLSSTLAHEINNPLTAVTYLLHLALQDEKLQPGTRDQLVAAKEELARAAHVASQTLTLDRPASEKSEVDVVAMVRDLLGIYRHRLQSRKVVPVARLDECALASVSPGELQQILSNLLVNAMDAAATRGRRLVIRVRNVKTFGPSPMVQITVADEGPGIVRALQKKIFEPFYTTKGNQGIGLGLWLTRELVKRNSGSIAVRSCTALRNSWTAFVIRLPAAQGADANRGASKAQKQAA